MCLVCLFWDGFSIFSENKTNHNLLLAETFYSFTLYNKKNLWLYFHKYILLSGENVLSSYCEHRVSNGGWSTQLNTRIKNIKFNIFTLPALLLHFILFLVFFFFFYFLLFVVKRSKDKEIKNYKKVTKANKISTEGTLIFTTIK